MNQDFHSPLIPLFEEKARKDRYFRVAFERAKKRLIKETDRTNENGCWVWQGSVDSGGYGNLHLGGSHSSHVVAYRLCVGEIPKGMELDHLCRNRRCCNPVHLEPVTKKINVLRGEGPCAKNARKTHCKHGHEFTPENTRVYENCKGWARQCIECEKIRIAKRHKKERKPVMHCIHGHEYTQENTRWVKTKNGPQYKKRVCRTCCNERGRLYYKIKMGKTPYCIKSNDKVC